jgi:hypothetical protein
MRITFAIIVTALAVTSTGLADDTPTSVRTDLGTDFAAFRQFQVSYERAYAPRYAFQLGGRLGLPNDPLKLGAGLGMSGSLVWYPYATARTQSGLSLETGVGLTAYANAGGSIRVGENVLYTWTSRSDLSLGLGGGISYNVFPDGNDAEVGTSAIIPSLIARLGFVY